MKRNIIILSLILFYSCDPNYCKELPERSSFIFEDEAKIIYISNLGNCDTLYVYDKRGFFTGQPNCEEVLISSCIFKSDLGNNDLDSVRHKSIVISTDPYYFIWMGIESVPYSSFDYSIGEREFNYVSKLTRDSLNLDTTLLFKEVYYNFRYGVLSYENLDGEIFTIQL